MPHVTACVAEAMFAWLPLLFAYRVVIVSIVFASRRAKCIVKLKFCCYAMGRQGTRNYPTLPSSGFVRVFGDSWQFLCIQSYEPQLVYVCTGMRRIEKGQSRLHTMWVCCRFQAMIGNLVATLTPRARIVPAVRLEDMSPDPAVVSVPRAVCTRIDRQVS